MNRGPNPYWNAQGGMTRVHEMSCAHLRKLLGWIDTHDDGEWGLQPEETIYDADERRYEVPLARTESEAIATLEAKHAHWRHLRGTIRPAIVQEMMWRVETNYHVLEAMLPQPWACAGAFL